MKSISHLALAVVLLTPIWHNTDAVAETTLSDCSLIKNDKDRLACYDSLTITAQSHDASAIPNPAPEHLTEQTLAPEIPLATISASEDDAKSLVERRIKLEKTLANQSFVITPHHRNYLLPITYNDRIDEELWDQHYPQGEMKHAEAKFQLSIKALVWDGIFSDRLNLWGAYTQENWWQVYTDSSPFRETNYQPELYLALENDWEFLGFTNSLLTFGFNHQSNGRGSNLSRSWNRIISTAVVERDRMTLAARLWYRLPESESDDDNKDILTYYGYGDLTGVWEYEGHEFSVLLKNNLRSDNKGAVQLEWTFPLSPRFKGYLQYYYGYGESLIDYDHITNRIGVGVSINDLL